MAEFDVLIVGGGPAGLSAALVLGRCRRRVLLCDAGRPRNAESPSLHGFLSRDGIPPLELLRLAREDLARYSSVELVQGEVVGARCRAGSFEIELRGGRRAAGRKLLLATGLRDRLPEVAGLRERLGKSVFHCPYCDGWELRDKPLAAFAPGTGGPAFARLLRLWSPDVLLCGDGTGWSERELLEGGYGPQSRRALRREALDSIEGPPAGPLLLRFRGGAAVERAALFFHAPIEQASPLPSWLGAELRGGGVRTGSREQTRVPGLYVAGDASKDLQLAIVAAAEGANAAFAINNELLADDAP